VCSSSRPGTTSRRSTQRRASPIRSSARTASSTSWRVSDYRSYRSPSMTPVPSSSATPRHIDRPSRARSGIRRRRPAPTARSASIPR
jgi:hypothetical protein